MARQILILLLLSSLWFLYGCATAKSRCVYNDKTGELRYSMARSTVIGKGTIDNYVDICKFVAHDSKDTGIDDNFVLLGAAIADAARKASVAGAVGGITESVIKGLSGDSVGDLKWDEVPTE